MDERTGRLSRLTDAMCEYEKGCPERIHHFIKVHAFARQIALREGVDADTLYTLEAAALAHDIGIRPALAQYGSDAGPYQERLGPPVARPLLERLGFAPEVIDRVCFLIGHHHTTKDVDGIDWRILLEADFLVNMIENHLSDGAIDAYRDAVFRTAEGLRLLARIRPAS